MTAFSATQIANWFVARAARDGEVLTNLKLQKLLHVANGWHLHFTSKELFGDQIEAWPYGPVVPTPYHAFKSFGAGGVSLIAPPAELTGTTLKVAEAVWKSYGNIPATTLVAMTHRPGTPWHEVYDDGQGRGSVIQTINIKKHYAELAKQNSTAN